MTGTPRRKARATSDGVAFADLQFGLCRYPVGAAWGTAQRYCGEPAIPGKPYCLTCCRIAYVPARSGERSSR